MLDKQINDTVVLVMRATVEYNKTLHSVINQKPIDVIHSASDEVKQARIILFEVGEKVYFKNNRRLGNKLTRKNA